MSPTMLLLLNAFPIVCVVCGTVLAAKQKEGWGWLFFIAAFSAVSASALPQLVAATPA